MQNWENYKHFMPDGMIWLFEGKYFWKMPPGVEINIGPTVVLPLPHTYREATERYSKQVQISELPDGALSLRGYRGGQPFPNPTDPHKRWKILANVWYRYLPHLLVGPYLSSCTQDEYGSIQCSGYTVVYRQLSYNTDPGVPQSISGAEERFYTEWLMAVSPEEIKYTTSLTISYSDLSRTKERFAFIPELRRHQEVSSASRCSPLPGTDVTPEDTRFGFDSDLAVVQAEFLGSRKIIALVDANVPQGVFPDGYNMPLGWPQPSWGKWQLRDVDVISVSRIPSRAAGYCYGRRVIYVDRATSAPLWEELYDSKLRPWKIYGLFLHTIDVPDVGPVNAGGSLVTAFWDIQNNHSTILSLPGDGQPFFVNGQVPAEYDDVQRYTTPGGLDLIMR
jgi:Protein of unknown function (DUF1329)